MELSRVNHVITAIIGMLTDLVDQGVIGHAQKDVLLPLLVLHAIRNDSIVIEES